MNDMDNMSDYKIKNEKLRARKLKEVKEAQKIESDKQKLVEDLESIKYSDLLLIKAGFIKDVDDIKIKLKNDSKNVKIMRELQLARFKVDAVNYRIDELQREAKYSGYGFVG